jgi:MoxR-like ATPase
MSHHNTITILRTWLTQQIIGQEKLVDRLLIALLADGHLLVEGAPGLAKTKAIKDLSRAIEGDFHRIQFTPDLLPSDITGTEIYRPEDGSFRFQPGPIFHNLVLADEINRAPAKVQSALLEAMAEHQVSVGRESFKLPPLFLVMATQNPIEQEGTYPLRKQSAVFCNWSETKQKISLRQRPKFSVRMTCLRRGRKFLPCIWRPQLRSTLSS